MQKASFCVLYKKITKNFKKSVDKHFTL